MGASTIASPQQSSGKGTVTTPGQGGQPAFGQPSMPQYQNTVGQWDNASIVQQPSTPSGKGGKGQQQWQPFQPTWNPQMMNLPDITNTSQPLPGQPITAMSTIPSYTNQIDNQQTTGFWDNK